MLIFPPKIFTIYFFIFLIKFSLIFGSDEEERLMVDIFRGYNSLILPMRNSSQPLTVKMGLQLLLLINVDEKDQIMQSNVWLTLKWHDFQLKWNPVNYGGVKDLRVSLDKVWLPDIVLFNNADGNYEVSYMSNVVIQYNGDMLWVPPAIYKSSCIIVCHLIFGSWTYNEKEIKMDFDKSAGIDLLEYGESKIWDVVGAPATLVNQRSRIEYQLRLRRKALFYTVVLIIPTVLMAFLSMAVFFLPTDSGEKMTLTISVLLSIVVFLLLVSKILPPTSSTIPLMAKYLLLTFVLNVITILVTVIIINIYFRSPITHQMPGWVRSVFLKFIPRLLCMRRPRRHPIVYRHAAGFGSKLARSGHTISINNGITGNSSARGLASAAAAILPGIGRFALTGPSRHHPHCMESNDQIEMSSREISGNWNNNRETREISSEAFPLSSDAIRAIKAIDYITDHLRKEEEHKTHRDDWRYVAMVIDRLLLLIFFGITLGGTLGVLLSAPHVFESVDQRAVLRRLVQLYHSGGQLF
ncbi:unnamed protein product [Meloidogyne enterolobii]|uniref:Uncharacterized protein n=2 Tax=Meloidogyne enterolobii TaxID=390850 RepID=A0ACB1AI64_MELEN